MLIKMTVLAGLALASLAPLPGLAQVADLTIRVVGADTNEGTVEISLFNAADRFMREPFLQMSGVAADDGAYEAIFAAVPTGEYAAVAVHDENGNGRLDNGLFGLGGEGYGFSNGVRPLLGWPAFEDAAVTLDADITVEIELD